VITRKNKAWYFKITDTFDKAGYIQLLSAMIHLRKIFKLLRKLSRLKTVLDVQFHCKLRANINQSLDSFKVNYVLFLQLGYVLDD
jgi:hypothetical protein